MAIAKRPNRKLADQADVEKFISGASVIAPVPEVARLIAKGRVATMVRFDAVLLAKVDAAARNRGVSRSAWIQFTLSKALED